MKKRILHIALSSFFTEGMGYQENAITEQNLNDGYDVLLIANAAKYIKGVSTPCPPENTVLENGLHLVRIADRFSFLSNSINRLFKTKELEGILVSFAPDIILFHSCSSRDLLTVMQYKKRNPQVVFLVDNHADFNNSATNFLSKKILHGMFFRWILQYAMPYIDKVLYISYDTKRFLIDLYKIDDEKLCFFPLGGFPISLRKKNLYRKKIFEKFGFENDTLLFIHSGKLDRLKRTEDILEAFYKLDASNTRIIIAGSFDVNEKNKLEALIKRDSRVIWVGWKTTSELEEYIAAGDLYLQPGSQSITMQRSFCCGTSVMLYPHKSYTELLSDYKFFIKTQDDIFNKLYMFSKFNLVELKEQSDLAFALADKYFNYQSIAKIVYGNWKEENK